MNREFVQDTIAKLLGLFERQDFAELLTHSIIRRHSDDVRPCDRWSIANRLLIMLAGTTDARGYKQWQEVGRHVRKGERSLKIVAPLIRRCVLEPEKPDDDPRNIIVGFVPIAVFALESTEGKPLPTFDYTPEELPPLWGVAERLGIRVRYQPFGGRYLGAFRPGKAEIELASQDAFVFFHEMAHAAHHQIEPLRPGVLARAEAVAEISACVLCHLQGIVGYEHSAYRYVASYAEEKSPDGVMQFVMAVLSDVEKVVLRILELAEVDISAPPATDSATTISA